MKFVILDHFPPEPSAEPPTARTQQRHFDLMFEVDGEDTLLTFALFQLPLEPAISVEFKQLENHRSEYLTYEGPVSNNRGSVKRQAHGVWTGELAQKAILSFDDESANFAGATWTIRIDLPQNLLFRVA